MSILQVALGIGYPVLILAALSWLEPRQTALIVLALTGARLLLWKPSFAASASAVGGIAMPLVGIAAVMLFTAVRNDPLGLLLAPVLVNGVLLASFGLSLWSERPMVERFARLQIHDLPADEARYCRSVTQVWCVFFVVNGGICLLLALRRDPAMWALYTGFVSYLLIGLLFAVEYVYRHWRFRRYRGGLADPLLRRLFPPQAPPVPVQAKASKQSPPRSSPR